MNRVAGAALGAAMVLVLSGGAVFGAQGPRFGGPGGPGRPGGPGLPLRELNLSDTQQQQVRAILEGQRDDAQAAREKLQTAMDAQRKAVEAVPVNESLIRSTVQDVAEAQAEVAILEARAQNAVWALLTPEQQAKLKTLRAERDSRRQDGRDQRPRRRQR